MWEREGIPPGISPSFSPLRNQSQFSAARCEGLPLSCMCEARGRGVCRLGPHWASAKPATTWAHRAIFTGTALKGAATFSVFFFFFFFSKPHLRSFRRFLGIWDSGWWWVSGKPPTLSSKPLRPWRRQPAAVRSCRPGRAAVGLLFWYGNVEILGSSLWRIFFRTR